MSLPTQAFIWFYGITTKSLSTQKSYALLLIVVFVCLLFLFSSIMIRYSFLNNFCTATPQELCPPEAWVITDADFLGLNTVLTILILLLILTGDTCIVFRLPAHIGSFTVSLIWLLLRKYLQFNTEVETTRSFLMYYSSDLICTNESSCSCQFWTQVFRDIDNIQQYNFGGKKNNTLPL